MGEEDTIPPTLLQKLLFYTTATFVLLAIFSLFAFLFLVPFVIDPAFTTIFMQFEPLAAFCVTAQINHYRGVSNCSWASCREGCTKDLYECTQIRVNYKLGEPPDNSSLDIIEGLTERRRRAIRDYEYETYDMSPADGELQAPLPTGLQGNDSEWFFTGARLYPNVKGCGYPPILNCTIFLNKYRTVGTNFTCYYSKVDPGLVMSDLDMWQNTLNLVYAMAIPIPTFIISVIYLAVAYFKIYSKDVEAEEAPLQDDAEAMATGEAGEGAEDKPTTPGSDTFREDLASFGHQFKSQRTSEKSHESFENHNSVPISNSGSITGYRDSINDLAFEMCS